VLAVSFALAVPPAATPTPRQFAAPPLGAKPVYVYRSSVDASALNATARLYADTASRVNSSCSTAKDVSKALSHVRVSGRVPATMLRLAKLLTSFGHLLLGVDSSCEVAQKLSDAANSLQLQAASIFPSCIPTSSFDLSCKWSYRLESRIDVQIRSFAPDVCYWTLATGRLVFGDNTVRYRPHNRQCR
jgi:hypothetical protein